MKYLALGDSYTIGELVPPEKNFPNQLIQQMKKKNLHCASHKIIATTGWTTDELSLAIAQENPAFDYDLVTLLIGVNNQYRERSVEEYSWQFYSLLCQSILFAQGQPDDVIVLSIPDWGQTPFNTERDKEIVSSQIDQFNEINKSWAEKLGCNYINITELSRKYALDEEYLTEDKLHLSEKMYGLWAEKLLAILP